MQLDVWFGLLMLVDVEVGMYQNGRSFAMLRHSNGRALTLRSRENGGTDNGTDRMVKTGWS